ncbi:hypothetical protein [Fictibacillus barbaricus]|uniref:ATP-dependent DNA ligase family profile domain-containing protein n=1 Tax=Fictibacillus barbaricus TaxID=182136 RepID=A0ABS2Z9K7_9BACL|nr:hypothetical protein [Fictibacillus barbaricus]MBN3543887.1 hypothetical protein [Fictibacillus barbaricus]GGB72260.1 hypothetical protein GCM10007199_43040 [Fictibacillus barbaricus]
MLLQKSDHPFDDQDYITELKLDGIRLLYTVDLDGNVKLYTRHHNEVTFRFKELLNLGFPPGTVIDGEIIITDDSGKPDFEAIMARFMSSKNNEQVTYVAFDILMYKGKSVKGLPLLARKELLAEIIPADSHLCTAVKFIESNGLGCELNFVTPTH